MSLSLAGLSGLREGGFEIRRTETRTSETRTAETRRSESRGISSYYFSDSRSVRIQQRRIEAQPAAVQDRVELQPVQQRLALPPVQEQTVGIQPVPEQTVQAQPVVEKPVVIEQPAQAAPVAEQTVQAQPVVEKPVVIEQPVQAAPVAEQTVQAQPVVEKPVVIEQPVQAAPVAEQTVHVEKPAQAAPVAEQKVAAQPEQRQKAEIQPFSQSRVDLQSGHARRAHHHRDEQAKQASDARPVFGARPAVAQAEARPVGRQTFDVRPIAPQGLAARPAFVARPASRPQAAAVAPVESPKAKVGSSSDDAELHFQVRTSEGDIVTLSVNTVHASAGGGSLRGFQQGDPSTSIETSLSVQGSLSDKELEDITKALEAYSQGKTLDNLGSLESADYSYQSRSPNANAYQQQQQLLSYLG